MAGATVQDSLEADYETELSRLGSSKAMYALTGGEMTAELVRDGVADRLQQAATVFESWAADGTADAAVDELADALANHASELSMSGERSPSRVTHVEVLEGLTDPADRAGGLLGWALVTDATLSQAVGFFVGSADPGGADQLRAVRTAVEEGSDAAVDALASDLEQGGPGADAASRTIEAAYEQYVETLEALGVKVKPVC